MSRKFVLNPNAQPFVPSFRLVSNHEGVAPTATGNGLTHNSTVQPEDGFLDISVPTFDDPQHQQHQTNGSIESHSFSEEELFRNNSEIRNFDHPISFNTEYGTEVLGALDEEEMDLAILSDEFPDLSKQSLLDVYHINACDLDASLDMLALFECNDDDFHLPNTLDVLEFPESTPAP